jgi:hypothetical protein
MFYGVALRYSEGDSGLSHAADAGDAHAGRWLGNEKGDNILDERLAPMKYPRGRHVFPGER